MIQLAAPDTLSNAAKQETLMDELSLRAARPRVPATSLSYRPDSFFADFDLQTDLLTHVKGRMRRAATARARCMRLARA